MEELVIETMTIGNRAVGIKDLYEQIYSLDKKVVLYESSLVIYTDNKWPSQIPEYVIYLNDFEQYTKQIGEYREYYDFLNTHIEYFIDLFGTNKEDIEKLKELCMFEASTESYKSDIDHIFYKYENLLQLKERLDYYFAVDTEEKYLKFLIDVLFQNINGKSKINILKNKRALIEKEKLSSLQCNLYHYYAVLLGTTCFLDRLHDNKETFENLRLFVIFCNTYSECHKKDFSGYATVTNMSYRKFKRQLKQFEKYLIKLGRSR